jgi:Tannase and feruloyl esterase
MSSMRLIVLILACAAAASAQDANRCAALSRVVLPDVEITSAAFTPAAAAGTAPGRRPGQPLPVALPAYCLVRGVIERRTGFEGRPFGIGFELRLPANWTKRFLFQGGGGMDGAVRPALGWASGADLNPALARGFAVVSTDAGHTGAPPVPETDASFARDQQARIDNAYRSIDRVTMVSKALVTQYYGEPWKFAYFDGCSNGGRQGLMAMQRLPTYFDGIVSGAPAFRVTHAGIGSAWETIAFLKIAPKDDSGRLIVSRAYSDADLKLVSDGVLKVCDTRDGLADGLVMNAGACRFDPAVLACRGAKTATCLTRDQVAVLKKAFDGPRNSRGESLYSDFPWDPGLAAPGWRAWKLGSSTTPEADSRDVLLMLSGLKGYFAYPFDPNFDPLKFDFDKDAARVDDTAALQDPTSTQVSTFVQRGGKILLYHGMADPVFSARDTARYYERLARDNGGMEQTLGFARYFEVPGMNHCSDGPALDNFDALGAVVNWVENGKAPEALPATGAAFPGVSRPLCVYPKHAQYKGTGATSDIASFECRE